MIQRPDWCGSFFPVEARNPETVCCEAALLACALLTVGVREHPAFPLRISHAEREGQPDVTWTWVFLEKSTDGQYQTGDLIKWWSDEAWLATHPQHEWTILRTTLRNMAEVAWRIRETVPRLIIRRGQGQVAIPADATPEAREKAIAQLSAV